MPSICIHEECKKSANFNYENEKKAIYCGEHKLDEMINIISKKCIHEECNKEALFGFCLATSWNSKKNQEF